MTIEDVRQHVSRGREEYERVVRQADMNLQGIISADPSHMDAANLLQKSYTAGFPSINFVPSMQPESVATFVESVELPKPESPKPHMSHMPPVKASKPAKG